MRVVSTLTINRGVNMTYWTVIGTKIENMVVVPLLKTRDINPVRKRHEARMERGKKVGVGKTPQYLRN